MSALGRKRTFVVQSTCPLTPKHSSSSTSMGYEKKSHRPPREPLVKEPAAKENDQRPSSHRDENQLQ